MLFFQSVSAENSTSLASFLHPDDVTTIREHLTQVSSTAVPNSQPSTFACRMRSSFWASYFPHDTRSNSSDISQAPHVSFLQTLLVGSTKVVPTSILPFSISTKTARDLSAHRNVFIAIARLVTDTSLQNVSLPPEPSQNQTQTEFFYRLTPHAKFVVVDDDFLDLLGYSVEDLIGRSLYNICHVEDLALLADSHRNILEPSLQNEPALVHRHRFLTKDNDFIVVRTMWQAFRNSLCGAIEALLVRSSVISQQSVSCRSTMRSVCSNHCSTEDDQQIGSRRPLSNANESHGPAPCILDCPSVSPERTRPSIIFSPEAQRGDRKGASLAKVSVG